MLSGAWHSMPEELEWHPRPRRAVVGQLPQSEFKVFRRDSTTQRLPRAWKGSQDAIRPAWETVILQLIYCSGLESWAFCSPPFYSAASLVVGMCGWHEDIASTARAASFGGLGLNRQFWFPCAEPVCQPPYNSDQFLSFQLCMNLKSPPAQQEWESRLSQPAWCLRQHLPEYLPGPCLNQGHPWRQWLIA
jgi:hypothetical protein